MPEHNPAVLSDPLGRDNFTVPTSSPTATNTGRDPAPGVLPPFDYQPLGRVVSERGALARLGEVVRSVGGSRVLLVTDPGLEHAGHPQRAARAMLDAGLEVFTFDGVRENPTEREVENGVAFAR